MIPPLVAIAPPVTRDGARDAARRELSKTIYSRDDPSALVRVVRAVLRYVDALVERAAAAAPGGGVGLVLLALLLIGLVVAIRLRVGPLARSAASRALLGGPTTLTAAEHRAAAERLRTDGRLAEAVRERLRAVARELEQRGVLEPRPGRTADEIAAEAAAALPGQSDLLRRATVAFDEVWYGGRPAVPSDYATLVSLDDAVRADRRLAVGGAAAPGWRTPA